MSELEGIVEWIRSGTGLAQTMPWKCPFCGNNATINQSSRESLTTPLTTDNKHGINVFFSVFVVCPNSECREYSLYGLLYPAIRNTSGSRIRYLPTSAEPLGSWRLVPASEAKVYPDYVPQPIREDYREAYLTLHLSPKASATLARRCLQGMIRDFFGVSKGNLKAEIEAIEDKVDPLIWQAIDAVRSVGNIGAHMEKDINLIVEVEASEAALLVGLIENLIEDWYVNRYEREQRLKNIVAVKDAKEEARRSRPKPE